MRHIILLLMACLCMTAYSQTTAQADRLVEEAKKLENVQNYQEAVQKLKQADKLYTDAGKTQSAERATCLHLLGRCYLSLESSEGLTYTQMAADMRKAIYGEVSIEYVSSLNNTGLYYLTVTKDYIKATEIHKKAWELCSRIQPRPQQAGMFHLNLARCYILQGDMNKARAIVEEEVAIARKQHGANSIALAAQLKQIGSLYYVSEHKEVGVTYYEQALKIFPDDSKDYEQLLDWISSIYVDLNNQPKILEYMKKVEAHNKKELEKPCDDPDCLADRAQYFASTGNNDKARATFLEALKKCNTNTKKDVLYKVRHHYAQFLSQVEDHASAGEYYELAADLLRNDATQQESFALECYISGLHYNIAADYKASIHMLNQAISVYSKMLPDKIDKYVDVATSLCQNYYTTKDYKNALDILAKTERLLPIGDKSEKMGDILRHRGTILYRQKQYIEAAASYKQAADIFKNLPNCDVKYHDALSNLDRCRIMMGNDTSARQAEQDIEHQQMNILNRLLNKELGMLDAYRQQWGEDGLMYTSSLGMISDIYYTKGETDKSLEYLEPFLNGETAALRNYFRLTKADERMAIWKNSRSYFDSIPLRAVNVSATGTHEQKQRFARLGYDALLFSKGIMLNSSIELETLIRASGDKTLLDKYYKAAHMTEEIKTMQSELSNAAYRTEARKKISKKKEEYEQLQLELMRHSTDFGDYTHYLSAKWQDVQKHLHGNSVAIEFALIDDELVDQNKHLAAFVLRPGDTSPIAVKMMNQKTLSEKMKLPAAFTTTETDFWQALDEYISKADTIYFSPDGVLHRLPVEYLPYGSATTPLAFQKVVYRLSSTKEIALSRASYAYSYAALFGGLNYEMASIKVRKITSQNRKFRNGQNGYEELPYTLDEVNNINSLLKKIRIKTNLFVGEKGTEKQFHELDGKAISLIHVATHGDYAELKNREADDAMKRCFLIMSGANATDENNDGLLQADEISTLNLRGCRMVVLSACNTGQGTLGADGLFGLQRGFKNAGVQTILMTLDNVDDQASMLLMTQFYKNLTSGISERKSLIRAQHYLRENGYSDSKYWTPFILLDARK